MDDEKVHVLGPRPRNGQKSEYRKLLALDENKPATLYVDLVSGVRAVIVPRRGDGQPRPETHLRIPRPLSPQPENGNDWFFYSNGCMENVHQVSVCRTFDRITGMILLYASGTRASIGRVAVDRLDAPQLVDSTGMWILGEHSRNPAHYSKPVHITKVLFALPEADVDEYLHVRWAGQLEWWSSVRQCEVHYEGRQTLRITK